MYARNGVGILSHKPSHTRSGLHQWAFTIETFARIYAKKFGIEIPKMMKRLWGQRFAGLSKLLQNIDMNVKGNDMLYHGCHDLRLLKNIRSALNGDYSYSEYIIKLL